MRLLTSTLTTTVVAPSLLIISALPLLAPSLLCPPIPPTTPGSPTGVFSCSTAPVLVS